MHKEFRWLRLDEQENAIDNLEMVHHFLTGIESERKWKWAIIALHQALYGFLISALRGTDGRLLLKPPSRKKPQERQLIGIWEALKRMKDPDSFIWVNAKPLETDSEDDFAIDRLINGFRNEFEHFKPKQWSIEVSGMPKILLTVLGVIEYIALQSNTVIYRSDREEEIVTETISSIKLALHNKASA